MAETKIGSPSSKFARGFSDFPRVSCLSVDAGLHRALMNGKRFAKVISLEFQDSIASKMICITSLGGNPKYNSCYCYLGGRRYDCEIKQN